MIKVLQITAALTEGGVETLLHTFYECVDKEKFHFDVACYSHADGVYRTLFEQQGCGILALPSKRKPLQSAKALYRALKEGQYDIVLPFLWCDLNVDDLTVFHLSLNGSTS